MDNKTVQCLFENSRAHLTTYIPVNELPQSSIKKGLISFHPPFKE
ncbi:hypothetical protein P369_24025 [Comamonas thiooxydans]|nr:hypothetical protein P369_24025 [Comamonas thiooxydans]